MKRGAKQQTTFLFNGELRGILQSTLELVYDVNVVAKFRSPRDFQTQLLPD